MASEIPTFSIIVPTRDRAQLLKRCIESVVNQKFTHWELVIIGDGSEDDTEALVKGFRDERIGYFFQEHQERSTARNHGIDLAKGQYICFIDDDDYVTPAYLQDFYDYYEKSDFPEVILRTGFIRRDGNKERYAVNYDERKHKNPVNFVAYNMCGVWSLAIPRVFLEKERFPEQFPHWQDTHLILRLFMEHQLVQLDTYNYSYFIHQAMGSQRAFLDYDPIERANLNVAAIEDLFISYKSELSNYFPARTLKMLKAEKFIEYSNSVYYYSKENSRKLLARSLAEGIYGRLWKHYILNILCRCRGSFSGKT